MSATKWIKVVATVTAIAGATVFWMAQDQTVDHLRAEKAALQRQLERMAQVEAANEQLSNIVAQADGSRADQQLRELLRLRNEVGMLRRQTNELQQALVQGERLQTPIKAVNDLPDSQNTNSPPVVPLAVYPKEAWGDVGYGTPEKAFQTLNWTALNGDLNAIRAALTAEMQKDFDKEFQNKTASQLTEEIKKSFNNKAEVRILSKKEVTDHLVVLEVAEAESAAGEQGSQNKLVFQLVDGVWKLAADH